MAVATRTGHLRLRTGPRDRELRRARICYHHLAGDAAVYNRLQGHDCRARQRHESQRRLVLRLRIRPYVRFRRLLLRRRGLRLPLVLNFAMPANPELPDRRFPPRLVKNARMAQKWPLVEHAVWRATITR